MTNIPEAESQARPAVPVGFAERIRERITAAATLKGIAVAMGLYLISVVALNIADAPLWRAAPGVTKPDLTFGYSYTQLVDILSAYGEAGRQAYALGLIVDTIMPVFFAAVTLLVVARIAPRWFWLLAAAPVVFLVFDVIENAALGLMVAQYPAVSPELVSLTRPLTMIKLSAFLVALPTLVLGTLAVIFQWIRSRRAS